MGPGCAGDAATVGIPDGICPLPAALPTAVAVVAVAAAAVAAAIEIVLCCF